MKSFSRFAAVLALAVCSVAAFAQSAVGNWTGHIDVSGVQAKSAKEKTAIEQMKKMFASAVVKLNMRGDKTYSVTFSGMMGMKPTTETGKWSQSGRTVSVLDKKGKAEKMTMSPNGKSMTMVPPSGDNGPKGMKIVFTRG